MILDELQPVAISLLIGLATGIERERNTVEDEGTMGVRTFALIALMGTVAAIANSPALTVGLALIALALISVGYWRSTSQAGSHCDSSKIDIGLTTEFAAGLVFALGYLSNIKPLLAATIGIILVSVLFTRNRLHTFSREVLRNTEFRAVLILAIIAFIIIPFIPDRTIDPWNLINLRHLAQIMAMIAGLEFAAYAIERYAGTRIGLLTSGFLGGIASSTAVFVNIAKMAKTRPEAKQELIGSGLMACSATTFLFVVISLVTSPDLGPTVALPASICALTATLLALHVSKFGSNFTDTTKESQNPLDLKRAIKLGLLIFGLIVLSAFTKRILGSDALTLVSFVGGLFELQGVTYANASLHSSNALTIHEATSSLLIALVASFISKIALCWILSSWKFAMTMTSYLLAIIGAGLATYLVILY
ncbi:MAG: MgtC/SapB family protein [Oligoflexales bacterium]|nr:MgtC/SapB family protein [Oligoflexales bacterium]